MGEQRLLSGNEALALGAWRAGVSVGCGYPGTPSTEILENLAGYPGVQVQWSPNEKVALEVASGASFAGVRTLVTMKHVGLNVAADPLFTLSYTGVGGGLVIVCADDPNLFSSQNEQDNRRYARAAKVPMLEPSDSQEAMELMAQAFSLSEEFDTPVLVRVTTRLSHSMGVVRWEGEGMGRRTGRIPEKNPQKLVMVPAHAGKRHQLVEERLAALALRSEQFPGNHIEEGSPSLGIVASGVAYQYAREVVPEASFLKLTLSHPIPGGLLREFAARVESLVVIEELDPVVEDEIRALGLAVKGKELLPRTGEYTPGILAGALRGIRNEGVVAPGSFPVVPRPPILCPGCPHRGIFHLLGKGKYFVTGDIGCYTLAALPPLAALDTCLCMGAGIGQALGIEKALGRAGEKVAAVIGDSTFFHSGIGPLLDVVHNEGHTLTVVLDNRTTAMTGRQDHPGTETNLMGGKVPAVDVAGVVRALGVATVLETDAFDLAGMGAALERASSSGGASVIVNRGPCVLLSRTKGAPVKVDPDRCTGCRTCHGVGCPAVGWSSGQRNARGREGASAIDAALCDGCSVCLQVCPFNAISTTAAAAPRGG
jgi:indolepyruvate ferredoxin oxidoreductase alpha subunit